VTDAGVQQFQVGPVSSRQVLHAQGPKNRSPRPPALDWIVEK